MIVTEDIYNEKVELFKSICDQFGRALKVKELQNNTLGLPNRRWFANHCPDKDVKTYSDFLNWLGIKKERKKKSKHRKYSFEIAKEEFAKCGYTLLDQEFSSSSIPLKFICSNHPDVVQEKSLASLIHNKSKCHLCVKETLHKGERNPLWKGGTSSLNLYLREFLDEWKQESMKNCNYRCVLSGDRFNDIHHLYSFNKILREVMEELNFPIYTTIKDYTQDQLKIMQLSIIQKHKEYPLGVCIRKDIHNLYHNLYGDDNTPEQFGEFVLRFNSGEFNEIIK